MRKVSILWCCFNCGNFMIQNFADDPPNRCYNCNQAIKADEDQCHVKEECTRKQADKVLFDSREAKKDVVLTEEATIKE